MAMNHMYDMYQSVSVGLNIEDIFQGLIALSIFSLEQVSSSITSGPH
jgi:hypothetical protein